MDGQQNVKVVEVY